jgi:hypothetical protein
MCPDSKSLEGQKATFLEQGDPSQLASLDGRDIPGAGTMEATATSHRNRCGYLRASRADGQLPRYSLTLDTSH